MEAPIWAPLDPFRLWGHGAWYPGEGAKKTPDSEFPETLLAFHFEAQGWISAETRTALDMSKTAQSPFLLLYGNESSDKKAIARFIDKKRLRKSEFPTELKLCAQMPQRPEEIEKLVIKNWRYKDVPDYYD